MNLAWVDEQNPVFPHPDSALTAPDGLLAVGGALNTATLIQAYSQGIFPWFEENQPILWWSPSQRAVVRPGCVRVSKSMAKLLRKSVFHLTTDRAFAEVIAACAAPRAKARGTWITDRMISAYCKLHDSGYAHSVECWQSGQLVGGLYGVQIGAIFCGESMFSRVSNSSKVAFIALSTALASKGFALIDCQLENPHLTSLGVGVTSRKNFLQLLHQHGNNRLDWPDDSDINCFPDKESNHR